MDGTPINYVEPKMTTMASQNIYDNTSFFEEYNKYPRSAQGLPAVVEWPLLRPMLPRSFCGLSVLDLGCGEGWFCRWAMSQGAARVCGMDVSRNMLDLACKLTTASVSAEMDHHKKMPVCTSTMFRQVDLEALQLNNEREAFDVVFSGLALHYVANLGGAINEVFKALRPGGSFVFSVEHPIFTAPRRPGFVVQKPEQGEKHPEYQHGTVSGGSTIDAKSRTSSSSNSCWPLTDYLDEGGRTVDWLGASVQKQHRTLSRSVYVILFILLLPCYVTLVTRKLPWSMFEATKN